LFKPKQDTISFSDYFNMNKIIDLFPFLFLLLLLVVFFITDFIKGWFSSRGKTFPGSFTSQAMMYNFLNEDKRKAMNYIIEVQAGEKEEEDDMGEKPIPGQEKTGENK